MAKKISVKANSLAWLEAIAATAPPEEDKSIHSIPKRKNVDSGASHAVDLGPLDVEKYLFHYGVKFQRKDKGNKTLYTLNQCLFDPNHGKDEAAITQDTRGFLTYWCFHDSCNHTWADARSMISGKDKIAQFCEGYDPDFKPLPKKSSGIQKKPYFSITEKGRIIFNAAEMADMLEEKYKPIIFEGEGYGETFYKYDDDTGVWREFPEGKIRKFVRLELGKLAKPVWIKDTINLLKDQLRVFPKDIIVDPLWLNLKNGMYHLIKKELVPHSPDFNSRAQLDVNYREDAKYSLWMKSLKAIFSDDIRKMQVLQQFFGYCLYPEIIFPAALFQIGGGANGKGVVEEILYTMLGSDNVSHISMKRMEKDFGPVEIKDKLLNTCSETETGMLEVTNFKKIAAGGKIQAEVKFKSDVKFEPIAKHMISMNEFPGIKDKTDAFYRRIIVLEYNNKFEGASDDKFLKKKLKKEMDGIFAWAIEGLEIVLEDNEIMVPETVEDAKYRFKIRQNPVLLYIEERCILDNGLKVKPEDIYNDYIDWCDESKVRYPLGKIKFYEQLYLMVS
jgi:P4 family phage/plasmid primase-like protien